MPVKITSYAMLDTEKEKKKTRKVFVDRDEAIAFFEKGLNEIKKEPDAAEIIYFWGVGGIGKSHLINHLFRETGNNPQTYEMIDTRESLLMRDQIRVRYNLDLSTNEIEILFTLRTKLKEEVKKRCQKDFDFFLFDYALLKYEEKSGTEHKTSEKSNTDRSSGIIDLLVSEAGMISGKYNLFDLGAEVSFLTTPVALALAGYKAVFKKLQMDQYRSFIDSLDYHNSEEILKQLHVAFSMDVSRMQNMLKKTGFRTMPFIIAIDTVERFFYKTPADNNNPEYDVSWLFERPGHNQIHGLLYSIPSVIWVLCGRDHLGNEYLDEEYQFQLERLDHEHVKEVMDAREIHASEEIVSAVNEVTEGVPAYLDICAELCIEKEDAVTKEDFEGGISRIAGRYMQLMSDTDKENLHLMTSLGQWLDEDFIAISDQLGSFRGLQQSYNRLIQKSFIQSEAGKRRIFHNIVREAFYADPDYSAYSKKKNYETIVSYYLSRMENPSLTDEDVLYYTDRVMFLLNSIVSTHDQYEVIRPLIEQCRNRLQSVDMQKCLALYGLLDRNRYGYGYGWSEEEMLAFENEYGTVLMNSGFTKTATDYYDRLYRKRTGIYGEDAQETIDALFPLCLMYLKAGRHGEASYPLAYIHDLYCGRYGDDDQKTLNVLSALADSFVPTIQSGSAKNCYEELYRQYCRLYGKTDSRSEEALIRLIKVLHRMKEDRDVQTCIEKGIAAITSDCDNPDQYANADLRIGRLYQAGSQTDQALIHFKKAYEAVGEDNSDALNCLVQCLHETQRCEEAYAYARQLYQNYVLAFGKSDQRTVDVHKRLADICMKTERYKEAKEHYEYLYQRNLTVLGEEHDDTQFMLGRLADTNYELGHDQEALSQYLKLSEVDVKTSSFFSLQYSPVSKDLIRKWKRFLPYEEGAAFYRAYFKEKSEPKTYDISDFGNVSVAPDFMGIPDDTGIVEACERTFRKLLKRKSISHPDTLDALHRLGYAYYQTDDYTNAIRIYRQLCDQYKRQPKKYHADALKVMEEIGGCYELNRQYDKALEIYTDLYNQKKEDGAKDRDTIRFMHKAGDMQFKTGHPSEALEICQKAYPMAVELLGEEDDETLDLHLDMGYALSRLHQYPEALEIFRELYEKRIKIHGETDFETIQLLEEIAFTCAAMDDLENALIAQNRYFDLYDENYQVGCDEVPF